MPTDPQPTPTTQPPPIRRFTVFGDEMRVKQYGDSTGGRYAVMEQTLHPGGGPPPHVHTREDEVFYIVDGEFDILLGDETIRARAGDVLNAPRDLRHTYHAAGDRPATIMFLTYPAGIEDFFAEVATLGFPPDLNKLAEAGKQYGLIFELPEASAKP